MKIKLGNIAYAIVQMVGNKANGDGVSFSSEKIDLGDTKKFLFDLLDKSLKFDELKHLDFVGGVQLNPIYNFVSSIFDDENFFVKEANNLATYLYQQSVHPSVKNGEFYVMKIEGCKVDGKLVDAVGLFKSEIHDTILKVVSNNDGIQVVPEKGMSLKKLDKGSVIFNVNREKGYVLSVLDSSNSAANYWTDAFLHAIPYEDSYQQTKKIICFYEDFLAGESMENIPKADKGIMMNKAEEFLKKTERFELSSFLKKVFSDGMKEQSELFKSEFLQWDKFQMADDVLVSKAALKQVSKSKLTTIKLDKNFDIKIKNGNDLLEQGYDEKRGMYYYKLFYNEEK